MLTKTFSVNPNYFQSLVGEYEWSYSDHWDINQSKSNNFGVRIDKKGYLYTFINGKMETKYKIESYSTDKKFWTYRKHNIEINGKLETFANGQKVLSISRFPTSSTNHFYTHE